MKLGWLVILVSGCVFHVSDDPFDKGEEASLWLEPSELESGRRTLVVITDDLMDADFSEVWEVRSVGAFTVVEWEGSRDRIDAVIDVDDGADGEQQIAVEFASQTAYAAFTVD